MNAALIADLESFRNGMDRLTTASTSETVQYEIALAIIHIERAIEWEKNRS